MTISEKLLKILVCPETKQPVHLADRSLLERLNSAALGGTLKNRGGSVVSEKLSAALVREDGAVVYPVRDDIPVMLVEESILVAR